MDVVVVGIDPSLTGTAVCRWPDAPVVLSSSPAEGVAGRINRFSKLAAEVSVHVANGAVVFLEGYSMGAKGNAITGLAEYGGILRLTLLDIGVTIVEVAPSQLKKFATGKGVGKKSLVAAHVAKRWDFINESEDATDSYVLARIGLCYSGQVEPDNQAQREVIETLKTGGVKRKKKTRATARRESTHGGQP